MFYIILAFIVGLLIGAVVSGLLTEAHWERKTNEADPNVCGCGHHLSFHAPKTGTGCVKTVDYTYGGKAIACKCQQFVSTVPQDPFLEYGRRELM